MLLLLLGIAVLYAAVFLLAPFFAVRKKWRALPAKGDVGRVLRRARARFHVLRDHDDPAARAVPRLPHVLAHGHARDAPRVDRARRAREPAVRRPARARLSRSCSRSSRCSRSSTSSSLPQILDGPLAVDRSRGAGRRRGRRARSARACASACSCRSGSIGSRSLTEHGEEYVAWAWAVNGFFAVIGSVLTTILSMALGFRTVQFVALAVYAIAVLAFTAAAHGTGRDRPVARRRTERAGRHGVTA